ncbi:MAG: hypothetical protein RLZ12_355, partial [Bacillota bacterium]
MVLGNIDLLVRYLIFYQELRL